MRGRIISMYGRDRGGVPFIFTGYNGFTLGLGLPLLIESFVGLPIGYSVAILAGVVTIFCEARAAIGRRNRKRYVMRLRLYGSRSRVISPNTYLREVRWNPATGRPWVVLRRDGGGARLSL